MLVALARADHRSPGGGGGSRPDRPRPGNRRSLPARPFAEPLRGPFPFEMKLMVGGDGRVDQVAAKPSKARQRSVLVDSGKPRIADDVGHQDRGQFSGLGHGATPPRPCQPFRAVRAKPLGGIARTREECRSLA